MVDFQKLAGKARDLAGKHGDKVDGVVDKAAKIADERTGGKYSEKIADGAERAKDAVDKVAGDGAPRSPETDPVKTSRPVAEPDPNAARPGGAAPVAEPDPDQPASGR